MFIIQIVKVSFWKSEIIISNMLFVFAKNCAKFCVKLVKENSGVLNFHLPGCFELVFNFTFKLNLRSIR